MRLVKKIGSVCLALILSCSFGACGGGNAYTEYSKAFKNTASVGSLNVDFDLDLNDGEQTVTSTSNMKMNSSNEVYYEMKINGKEIIQYVQDGKVHTFVDGEEQITSTEKNDSGAQKANPEGGEGEPNEKTDGTSFNIEKFLEEFSGMLEAGKIKELGVLDPIPSNYIKEIVKTEEGSNVVYTMTFPDEFLSRLLNVLIDEQVGSTGLNIEFSNLKDFQCVSKENADGYLYYIQYKGYTTVTVPADLMASGTEESFDLDINLQMEIQNPGTAVDVVIPE